MLFEVVGSMDECAGSEHELYGLIHRVERSREYPYLNPFISVVVAGCCH